jgi:ABC-2 type transport system permease protein
MTGRRAIALVAWREIRERLRSRAFLVSTLILLVFVGATAGLEGAITPERTFHVAVTAPVPPTLDPALQRAAEPFQAKVELRTAGSVQAARRALEAEDVDAVLLLDDDRIVFRAEVDDDLAAVADTAVRAVRRRLPPAPELTAATLEPVGEQSSQAEVIVAAVGALAILMTLSVYGNWVLVGVVEEKSNRVVELILATVRPHHLLAGKVIGIGLLGLAQLTLAAGLAVVMLAAGVFNAPAELGGSVALVVPWFALGFALYAVAFAAAGALASRQQDAGSAGQPVALTLVAVYMAGYVALSEDADSAVSHALTLFPASSPIVLPARHALVGVPLWEHALAIVLVLAAIYALVRFAGRVYAHGLLYGGPRLGARAAWRLTRGGGHS